MKKIFLFSVLLSLVLLSACGVIEEPEPLHTAEYWNTAEHVEVEIREGNGYVYRIFSDKTCSLMEVDGTKITDKTLILAEEFRGIPVTEIEDRTFAGAAYEEVVLPAGIRRIGQQAFQKSAVRRVVLPDSVSEIGEECFDNCLFLESVTFGKGLKKIPTGAFFSCPVLKEILLPEGVEEVGEEAFASCRAVERVSLPSTLKIIGDYAFWHTGTDALTIEVPAGARVGEAAFEK